MDYLADVGITILIYIILGVSLNLLLGYAGQVSMAHAVFYGIGAYTAGLLTLPVLEAAEGAAARGVTSGLGWNWLPALLIAVAVPLVFAFIIAIPAVVSVTGEYLILLTLAFQVVVNQLMNSLTTVTGGPYGLTPIPPFSLFGHELSSPPQALGFFVVAALLAVFVTWRIGESPFGRLLKGIREDEIAVRALGKNTLIVKVTVFGVAAAIAGMAGALASYYYQFIAPGNYSLDLSIFVVAVVVLGGAGNLIGTILGAIVLGSLTPLLQNIAWIGSSNSIPWQGVIYGVGLVIIMRFRPQGILPEGLSPRWFKHAARSASAELTGAAPGSWSLGVDYPDSAETCASGDEGDEGEDVVRISGLARNFGGLRAVDGVDMALRRGRITALIGPNGAGKTTIFNMVTGELKPDSGQVWFRGTDVVGEKPHKLARFGIVRSFQDVRVFQQLSALENVAMAVPGQPGENLVRLGLQPRRTRRAERETRAKAHAYLDFVGMSEKADELVVNLSFGEQKLVAIARLLATEGDVLLLDEPTSGIDANSVNQVIDLILRLCRFGKTVCIVEHSVHVVDKLADHVYFLDHGAVIEEGTMKDLTSRPHLVEVYFGT
ncbi:MAG: branched-chain amino acid ABC transporter ATP-binding protein/permease [Thermoleophilia bacterium]|nr:branched-chain amino acid ABC transporter ATP-binding protein/permease [Thermoleophilia bacterium]